MQHFCVEWDFLFISPGSTEWELCMCSDMQKQLTHMVEDLFEYYKDRWNINYTCECHGEL